MYIRSHSSQLVTQGIYCGLLLNVYENHADHDYKEKDYDGLLEGHSVDEVDNSVDFAPGFLWLHQQISFIPRAKICDRLALNGVHFQEISAIAAVN